MIEKTWQALTAAGTIAVAVVGGSWGVWEYEADKAEERKKNAAEIEIVGKAVQGIQQRQDLDRYLYLNDLRKKVGLDPEQHREWCVLRRRIYGTKDCPAWNGRRPRND